ncbi:hypothetical protein ACSNN7_06690 [Micromonospora sp. URMC 105]|uniref:hypothetical protein n=1 Tax=Micromonospora sp. URMC 105 TaxID=3423413 RepID=UPI003F1AF691
MIDGDLLRLALIGAVVDESPGRALRIDSLTDQLGAYSDEEAYLVVWCLAHLVVDGLGDACREAALHAIAEIVEWHAGSREAARVLSAVSDRGLSDSEREYLENISDLVAGS